jgi:hypothetical protein
MAIGVTQATPLKLPEAPGKYDKRDQDHTRRLIELAFGQFAASIQATSVAIQTPIVTPKDWVPVSPIMGEVVDLAVATPTFYQLLNPISAKKYVIVYRFSIEGPDSATSHDTLWRVTSSPVNLDANGSPVAGTLVRMDENDVTAITSSLRKVNMAVTTVLPALAANGDYRPVNSSSAAYSSRFQDDIISPMTQPIVLAPGDALEMTNGDVGGVRTNGMMVVFDEIPLTSAFPAVNSSDTFRPISSVMSAVRVAAGNLATIQLLNPIISPKRLRVLVTRLTADGFSVTTRWRMRRTRTPLHMGGTIVTGALRAIDGRNKGPIYGILQACTAPAEGTGNLFPESDSFYFDRAGGQSAEANWTGPLEPFTGPIYLGAGMALELQSTDSTVGLYGNFLWDEV